MKIIILHGQNFDRSYERLSRFIDEAKKRNWEILHDEVSSTPSLFGKERLIVIRNLSVLTKNVIKSLDKLDGTLVVYSGDDIPQSIIKSFSKAKIEKFDVSKSIWKFLDKPTLMGFHEVIKDEPVEFVFALLSKRIRDLLFPPSHYQPWQIGRLKNQKAEYTDSKLIKMIGQLAEIDKAVKTGEAELTFSLDLFITKNLQ